MLMPSSGLSFKLIDSFTSQPLCESVHSPGVIRDYKATVAVAAGCEMYLPLVSFLLGRPQAALSVPASPNWSRKNHSLEEKGVYRTFHFDWRRSRTILHESGSLVGLQKWLLLQTLDFPKATNQQNILYGLCRSSFSSRNCGDKDSRYRKSAAFITTN